MTVQEKLNEIASLKQEIKEIEEGIKKGKQLKLDKFLDEAVGNYVRFTFDESDDLFLMVNGRRGGSVIGDGIVFYPRGNFETVEEEFFRVDIDSDFKILKEIEWKCIINSKIMKYLSDLC